MGKDSRGTIALDHSILARMYYQCRGRASTISLQKKMRACAFVHFIVLQPDEWPHCQPV